jgi:hemolysin type calcium-binding protein
MLRFSAFLAVVAGLLALAPAAGANTSHEGWPEIDMLLMNKTDRARPLDARPGADPLGATDPRYSCDAVHKRGPCQRWFVPGAAGGRVVGNHKLHSELLGGHGNDVLRAGDFGDVLWGDYKPSGQPSTQRDVIIGGAQKDFIYASHGTNAIAAGGGDDWIKAHFGRGTIDCGGGNDLLFVSRRVQRRYVIRNCERISHKTLGR